MRKERKDKGTKRPDSKTGRTREDVLMQANLNKQAIYDGLKEHGATSMRKIAERHNITPNQAVHYIKAMMKKGSIRSFGPNSSNIVYEATDVPYDNSYVIPHAVLGVIPGARVFWLSDKAPPPGTPIPKKPRSVTTRRSVGIGSGMSMFDGW